jgi:hypothetical protein
MAKQLAQGLTAAQRAWFADFAAFTGGDAHGLEDFEAGLTSFAVAAQHSIACFRQDSHDIANRLEHALNPLIQQE